MIYKSLQQCVNDLEKHGQLIRIEKELDPNLEIAELQRQVFERQGPALYFEKVKNSPFPAVSNLFGTIERSRFIFRSTLRKVQSLIQLKADPVKVLKSWQRWLDIPLAGIHAFPARRRRGPVFYGKTTIDQLPQIKCWPKDGGAFILLPQVYSEDPYHRSTLKSNLGMYRIQLSGNDYVQNKEIGLHYQIRRDIGIHHSNAIKKGEPLQVSVFIGGPPAHTFAAVMPLPEGMPEVLFAGALAGRRFRFVRQNGNVISSEADFVITGEVYPGETKPEGPFGDHLGYYSEIHDFPFMRVKEVYHRKNAVWPFTVVGRPPQEDTMFGELIHEITGPMVPVSLPGVDAVHAVDAAGVHPLLLAIGRERYEPYHERRPMELLTLANSILGFGHCSLAKYLFICAYEDNPDLDIHNIQDYYSHILERVDWTKDLHFQTETTIDTLDYSGSGFNRGSKVIIAVAGAKKRTLASVVPNNFRLSNGFSEPHWVMPGILAVKAPPFINSQEREKQINELINVVAQIKDMTGIPLIILCDDSEFTARNLNNFLWVTFTRSNPSHDIYGIGSSIKHKHWGCTGSLIIDAGIKAHHAPALVEDPKVIQKINDLGAKGGPLYGII